MSEIERHAAADYPHECCGGLLGTIEEEEYVVDSVAPVTNTHHEGHERRYSIAPEEMLRLEKQARACGLKVIGFYHSHPDHPAIPSEYDREHAWPWYAYLIVAVDAGVSGTMTCWTLNDDRGAFREVSVKIHAHRRPTEES